MNSVYTTWGENRSLSTESDAGRGARSLDSVRRTASLSDALRWGDRHLTILGFLYIRYAAAGGPNHLVSAS